MKPNKWFNLEVTNIDERCDTGTASKNCTDATDVIVLNSKLSNVLDTGLTQCLKGKDKRWAVDCAQVENGSEAGTVDYRKQDAQQTDKTIASDLYPDLAYTFVNGTGEPVPEEPTAGEVCVQDNNTGFIWSGTILDSSNSYKNIRTYTAIDSIAEKPDYDCYSTTESKGLNNADGKIWQLPSVQDLMTIMDIENLKTARDFGVRFTDLFGENLDENNVRFYKSNDVDDTARYWTSTGCGFSHYFILNFLNGELACAANTEEHSIMMVYK
jgi:hypothetical protein